MSKMKMPEMSVVRFTESDVIVASMPNFVGFYNFNDVGTGSKANGRIVVGSTTYGYQSGQIDISTSIFVTSGASVETRVGGNVGIGNLVNLESDNPYQDSDQGVDDGIYTWDPIGSTYKKQ